MIWRRCYCVRPSEAGGCWLLRLVLLLGKGLYGPSPILLQQRCLIPSSTGTPHGFFRYSSRGISFRFSRSYVTPLYYKLNESTG